jgi:putative phosphoribosyl transferase
MMGRNEEKVRIVSRSQQPFLDRREAGELLAREMGYLTGKKVVVLGIPRGGVAVARVLAQKLGADIDIVLSRKLGTPGQSELAMGSIGEDGQIFLNPEVLNSLKISEASIRHEQAIQMEEITRRCSLIRGVFPKISLKSRIVVVTDDGVATGATMQAAIWAIRKEHPEKLIAALPVASEEAVNRIAPEVDELLCLRMPPDFAAVGQFYYRFDQISDREVLEILKEEKIRMDRKSK